MALLCMYSYPPPIRIGLYNVYNLLDLLLLRTVYLPTLLEDPLVHNMLYRKRVGRCG